MRALRSKSSCLSSAADRQFPSTSKSSTMIAHWAAESSGNASIQSLSSQKITMAVTCPLSVPMSQQSRTAPQAALSQPLQSLLLRQLLCLPSEEYEQISRKISRCSVGRVVDCSSRVERADISSLANGVWRSYGGVTRALLPFKFHFKSKMVLMVVR